MRASRQPAKTFIPYWKFIFFANVVIVWYDRSPFIKLFVRVIHSNFSLSFLQGDSFHRNYVPAGLSNWSMTLLLQHIENTGTQKTPKTWETLRKRAGKSISCGSNDIHWCRVSYLLWLNVWHCIICLSVCKIDPVEFSPWPSCVWF